MPGVFTARFGGTGVVTMDKENVPLWEVFGELQKQTPFEVSQATSPAGAHDDPLPAFAVWDSSNKAASGPELLYCLSVSRGSGR